MRNLLCVLILLLAFQPLWAASPPRKAPLKKAAAEPLDAGVPDAAEATAADPCARNTTCPSCVTSMTVSCGWCVDTGTCVFLDEGACGVSFMAGMATQCPPPGPARAPLPRASSMATANKEVVKVAQQPMPEEAFETLLDGFKEASTEAERLALLEEAVASHHFRVAQAMQVVDSFENSAAKMKVCRLMRTRVADRQNLFQFYGRFRQEADRKQAQRIMEGKE
jgi:hypothetical protein